MTERTNKRSWIKPTVQSLNIKKDTFSGSPFGGEGKGGGKGSKKPK